DPVTSQRVLTVAQFTAAGAVDTGFGTGGQASVSFGDDPRSDFSNLRGMTLQPDGKVVVVGSITHIDPITFSSIANFAVARLTVTGSLDTTFGRGGKVRARFNNQDRANAALVRADGTIAVVGMTQDAAFYTDYALAEYTPDGILVRTPRRRRSG